MREKSYGGIVVISFICILAFCCGAAGGMLHIGESFSEELIPISVSTPVDTVSVINEASFQASNITVKLYVPQTTKKTTTNTTNKTSKSNSTNKSTNGSSGSGNKNSTKKSNKTYRNNQ